LSLFDKNGLIWTGTPSLVEPICLTYKHSNVDDDDLLDYLRGSAVHWNVSGPPYKKHKTITVLNDNWFWLYSTN